MIIDLLDFDLNPITDGPLLNFWDVEYTDLIDGAGSFSFRCSPLDPKAAAIEVQKTVVRIWPDEDSPEYFLGYVDQEPQTVLADDTSELIIQGVALLGELADAPIELELGSALGGVNDAPADILTAANNTISSGAWSLDTTNGNATTAGTYYTKLEGPSALKAQRLVGERIGEHFIYRPWLSGSARKLIWIGAATTDSGVRATAGGFDTVAMASNPDVCYIQNMEKVTDGTELVNRIKVRGAGQSAETALTILDGTYDGVYGTPGTDSYITVYRNSGYMDSIYSLNPIGSGGLGYRRRMKLVQFEEISPISPTDADIQEAADMVVEAGIVYLKRYAVPHEFYKLEVLSLPARVRPGQTIRADYVKTRADGTVVFDVDDDLIIQAIHHTFSNDDSRRYILDVATTDRPPNDPNGNQRTYTELEKGQVYRTYRQEGPNRYNEPINVYVGEDQADAKGDIVWFFDPETLKIRQVVVRFEIRQLVSATNVAGGSASVNLSTDPHQHDVPGHVHEVSVNAGSAGAGTAVEVIDVAGTWFFIADTGDTRYIDTRTGSGAVTSDANTVVTGTVDLSSAITNTFGIFLELLANTFSISDLEYQVNSGGWNNLNGATTISVSPNVYELDITDAVDGGGNRLVTTAGTFRPVQVRNLLEIRRKSAGATGKTCQLIGSIKVRETIIG